MMASQVIRPSMKQVKVGYVLAVLVVVAAVVIHAKYLSPADLVSLAASRIAAGVIGADSPPHPAPVHKSDDRRRQAAL